MRAGQCRSNLARCESENGLPGSRGDVTSLMNAAAWRDPAALILGAIAADLA
jgi:hypothetical protein